MTDPTTQDLRTTTERELIQQLAEELSFHTRFNVVTDAEKRRAFKYVQKARAYLAQLDLALEFHSKVSDLSDAVATLTQPEPEGPTKAELKQLFDDQSGFINDEQVMWWSDFHSAARAVLARWGAR